MIRRRVVVTGVGAVTPLGVGANALIDRWAEGESGIVDGLGACLAFEPADHLRRKEVMRNDRFVQLAIVAADEAMAAARWKEDGYPADGDRIGCLIGTASGGQAAIGAGWQELSSGGPTAVSGLFVQKTLPNAAAGVLAIRYGLEGPCSAVVSACSSGADALADAIRMLRLGEVDAMIVGGAEAGIVELPMAAFKNMETLSPSGVSRPFDARRDGFVMGEGAGVLVLEAAEVAEWRCAPILGEVLGYAMTNDAYHVVAPHPEGRGAAKAIRRALGDARVEPHEVDYVNAHGTATPANDRAETLAIKDALGDRARDVPVSSLKSAIGHLMGAAGAVESIATMLALRDGIAPPTLNYDVPDEGLDLDYVPHRARPLGRNGDRDGARPVALTNSFGFGGHNSVLVLAGAP